MRKTVRSGTALRGEFTGKNEHIGFVLTVNIKRIAYAVFKPFYITTYFY